MLGQVCLWLVLLILFETVATFIRLTPFFVVDVAGSLEAHVLAFLDLRLYPWAVFFRFKPLEIDASPLSLRSH